MRRYSSANWAAVGWLLLGSAAAQAGEATSSTKGNSRWGANYFPNVPLITHEGKTVRFFDDLIKDKVVVINFIYTTCAESCPLETARLREVQAILGDRVGRDIFMYSITIDPERDTPEVLMEYTKKFLVGPGWLFLTGKEADITLLRKKLGLYIQEIQDGSFDHNLSLIIGNQATGRWMKSSPFENPYVLAKQIGSWLHNWKMPSEDRTSYADAPQLRALSKGESLFRTRCAACHTIGGGDTLQDDGRRIGPDLLGVMEMRDRKWLTRWLKEPQKMLQEKDPIAMGMLAKYRNVPMPNMRLNPLEVERLLEYMDTESRRVQRGAETEAVASAARDDVAKKPCCMKKEGSVAGADETPSFGIDDVLTLNTEMAPAVEGDQTPIVETNDISALGPSDAPALISVQTVSLANSGPRRSHQRRLFSASMILSTGLGCAFLLLATLLRRRSELQGS